MIRIKKLLAFAFLLGWAAGEAPRLWWKEAWPIRPMDVAAGLIFLAEIIGNKNYKSYKNIGLIIAALAGALVLGPYAVRTLVYGWLIWRGGEIFSRVRKWVAPAMASFLILGLGQYVFLPDMRFLLQYGWDEHYYRLIGTVLDPNYFGVMAGMILLSSLGDPRRHFFGTLGQGPSLTSSSPLGKSTNRVLPGSSSMTSKMVPSDLLMAFLSLVVLVLTFSRASWAAVGAGMGWWVLAMGAGKLRRLGKLGLLGVFGVIVWWAAAKPGGEGVNLLRTSSIQQRFTSWNEAISVWKEHPWVGTGFNNYGVGSKEYGVGNAPSSSWLLILAATGIVGLGILGSLGILVIREIRGDRFWMAMAIMVGVHAIFNNTLFYPPVLGLLALLRVVKGAR